MFPAVSKPTRVTENSATLIDNIFVNGLNCDISSAIIYNDLSDHYPVAVHLKRNMIPKTNFKNNYVRKYCPEAVECFSEELANVNWEPVYKIIAEERNPNAAYNEFIKIYKYAFNKYFPEKKVKISRNLTPRNVWITKGLMKSCVKKSKLYKKYCLNRTEENKKVYITYRNKLKLLLRKAERSHYADIFKLNIGNIKETWKIIGQALKNKTKENIPDFFMIGGKKIEGKQEIVNHFNQYFANIGAQLASTIPQTNKLFNDYLKSPNLRSFTFYPTDPNEISLIGANLNNKTSFGYDSIPTNIMKASLFC